MDRYVVIAEFPEQAPMVLETEITLTTDEHARERMRQFRGKGAIRLCVAKLTYVSGNEALLPKE